LQLFETARETSGGCVSVGMLGDRDQASAHRALDQGTRSAAKGQDHAALAVAAELPALAKGAHQGLDVDHQANDIRWPRRPEWAERQEA